MVDGRLHAAGDRWQVVFTRHLAHSPQKVWRALTQPEDLAAWFPTEIHGPRQAGARLRFTFPGEGDAEAFEGEMLEWDPPRALAFTWGEDELRFELEPQGDGTLLTLAHTFDDVGKAARDAAGWHGCLDLLAAALDGAEPGFDPRERWGEVHPAYVERFGPEAATIGPPG